MRLSLALVTGIIGGVTLVSGNPVATSARFSARATDSNACAKVGTAAAAFASASPGAKPQVPAQIAYDCLKSVPLKKDPALELTRALKSYTQLQSSIDFLRNPPSGYLWDPVDIPRLLDAIETKLLSKDTYDGEYDFQIDLQSALAKARDGHFAFIGDVLRPLQWLRPLDFNVISVSVDGKALPKVYAASDFLIISDDAVELADNSTASAITEINGLDVETFFLADANSYPGQDPDNAWNSRFFSLEGWASKEGPGLFNAPTFYPGPQTAIKFANGTTLTLDNAAVATQSFNGISTGDDFYQKFCTGKYQSMFESRKRDIHGSLMSRQSSSKSSLYPEPVITDDSEIVAGYYLDDSDVAVLVVRSFLPSTADSSGLLSFQSTVTDFFADAIKEGKKKLVVDLQGNGGGSIDLSNDLIAQLFPQIPPNSKDNMRASVGMYSVILAASNIAQEADSLDRASDAMVDEVVVPFAFQEVITPEVKNFNRLQDFYGPVHSNHGFFTNYFQDNYTNDDPSEYGLGGIVITGTNNRTDFEQPFKAEDIILLTDGSCASRCTVFSEHMKRQGVQVITMGGRPQTGPMQAVGGTKGSQIFQDSNIDIMLTLFGNKTLNTALDQTKGTLFEHFNYVPLDRSVATGGVIGINARNQYRIGDTSETPLQFVYEAADCRIFVTPEMLVDPVAIWSRVATLGFDNRKNGVISSEYCVQDSTKHATSISGGLKTGDIGPQTPPKTAKSKVSGFLLNGKDITDSLAASDISDKSPVDPSVAQEDGQSAAQAPDVIAAVGVMNSICTGYSGNEWFVQLVCGALQKHS